MKIRLPVMMVLLTIFLFACATANTSTIGSIRIKDPWVRSAMLIGAAQEDQMDAENQTSMEEGEMPGMNGVNTAAFMVLENTGNEDDRLVSAQSDVASAVEIHLSEMKDGIMSMRPVDGVEIPAGEQVKLEPGGYHVMLIGIIQDLKTGEIVSLQLNFEKAGSVNIEAEVRNP